MLYLENWSLVGLTTIGDEGSILNYLCRGLHPTAGVFVRDTGRLGMRPGGSVAAEADGSDVSQAQMPAAGAGSQRQRPDPPLEPPGGVCPPHFGFLASRPRRECTSVVSSYMLPWETNTPR